MGVMAVYPKPNEETIRLFAQKFGVDNSAKSYGFLLNQSHTVAINTYAVEVSEDRGIHSSSSWLTKGEFILSGRVHLGRISKYGFYRIGKGVYEADQVKRAIKILCDEYSRWVDFWNFCKPGVSGYVLGLGNSKALILIAPVVKNYYGEKPFEKFIIQKHGEPLMVLRGASESIKGGYDVEAETGIEVDVKLIEKWMRELGLDV